MLCWSLQLSGHFHCIVWVGHRCLFMVAFIVWLDVFLLFSCMLNCLFYAFYSLNFIRR
jgi:hypothetical protein